MLPDLVILHDKLAATGFFSPPTPTVFAENTHKCRRQAKKGDIWQYNLHKHILGGSGDYTLQYPGALFLLEYGTVYPSFFFFLFVSYDVMASCTLAFEQSRSVISHPISGDSVCSRPKTGKKRATLSVELVVRWLT